MKTKKNKGFTITELLVATAVFSLVLLLAVVGFIQVGRLFYKGVTVAQTRQTASQVLEAITSDVRLSSGVRTWPFICNSSCSATDVSAYCIGSHLYVANLNNLVNLSGSSHDFTNNFGLIQSQISPGSCGGGSGPNKEYQTSDLSNPVELLSDNMRLSEFLITPENTYTYRVAITVSYGEDNVFNNLGAPQPTCKGIATGSQFCSVIHLSSVVSYQPALNL